MGKDIPVQGVKIKMFTPLRGAIYLHLPIFDEHNNDEHIAVLLDAVRLVQSSEPYSAYNKMDSEKKYFRLKVMIFNDTAYEWPLLRISIPEGLLYNQDMNTINALTGIIDRVEYLLNWADGRI